MLEEACKESLMERSSFVLFCVFYGFRCHFDTFELMFKSGVRQISRFIFLSVVNQFFVAPLRKVYFLASLHAPSSKGFWSSNVVIFTLTAI